MTRSYTYSSCYVNSTIEIYSYDNNGKGISALLRGCSVFCDT
ncbi:MAG: ssDNA-binding protein [Arsenophonus sp.]